jgi:putative endonuclease
MTTAIQREKTIKKWKREWKINLIERENPNWDDLFPGILKTWF